MKVRIAVAVDSSGEWNCSGWGFRDAPTDDQILMLEAAEDIGPNANCYFIEAEIEIPAAPRAIQATAEKA